VSREVTHVRSRNHAKKFAAIVSTARRNRGRTRPELPNRLGHWHTPSLGDNHENLRKTTLREHGSAGGARPEFRTLGTSGCASCALAAMAVTALLAPLDARSALPTVAGWYAIPQTQLRTVCRRTTSAARRTALPRCARKSSLPGTAAVMDTTRNRLIVWGGGHNDYAGNELYAVNLNDLTIQRLNNPSVPTNAGGPCTVTTLADGPRTAAILTTVSPTCRSPTRCSSSAARWPARGATSTMTHGCSTSRRRPGRRKPVRDHSECVAGGRHCVRLRHRQGVPARRLEPVQLRPRTDRYTRLASGNKIDYH
jgi:hypothetical protein